MGESVKMLRYIAILLGAAPLIVYSDIRQETIELDYGVSSRALTLHEPVVFAFEATNQSRDTLRLEMGWNRLGAFVFEVVHPDGTRSTARPAPIDGGSLTPDFVVEAGGRYRQEAALNHWVRFEQVGPYRISVRSSAQLSSRTNAQIRAPQSKVFDLNVQPVDVARLRARCEQLVDQASRRGSAGGEAADHLAVIRHVAAVPCLQRALVGKVQSRYDLIETLVRIGGPEARAALQEVSRSAPDWIASAARAGLARIR